MTAWRMNEVAASVLELTASKLEPDVFLSRVTLHLSISFCEVSIGLASSVQIPAALIEVFVCVTVLLS